MFFLHKFLRLFSKNEVKFLISITDLLLREGDKAIFWAKVVFWVFSCLKDYVKISLSKMIDVSEQQDESMIPSTPRKRPPSKPPNLSTSETPVRQERTTERQDESMITSTPRKRPPSKPPNLSTSETPKKRPRLFRYDYCFWCCSSLFFLIHLQLESGLRIHSWK